MAEWELPAANELGFLYDGAAVPEDDRRRLREAFRALRTSAVDLQRCMERQMDLEAELSWLSSKYEHLAQVAEEAAAAYRAEVIKGLHKNSVGPQWACAAIVESDPKYRERLQLAHAVRRMAMLTDRLFAGLRRRESMLRAMSYKERGFAGGEG